MKPLLGKLWEMISRSGVHFSTLPMPSMESDRLNDLSTVSLAELEAKYNSDAEELKRYLAKQLSEISSKGRFRTGQGLYYFSDCIVLVFLFNLELSARLESLITAANSNALPDLPSLAAALLSKIKEETKTKAMETYDVTLKTSLVSVFI